jgi:hypothetical protein
VYARTLDQKTLTFFVSGTLERQVLVIEDRETQTRWSQLTGLAIGGPLQGRHLRQLGTQVLTWMRWRARFPMSSLYAGSAQASFFGSGARYGLGAGARGHSELVLGTRVGSAARGYALGLLDQRLILDDVLGGIPIVVAYAPDEGFGLVWDRRVGDHVLDFRPASVPLEALDEGGGRWDLLTGSALSGPDAGSQLTGIWATPAYAAGWARFFGSDSIVRAHPAC